MKKALIITRRELKDSLRDWRIIIPISLLTLVFPWIMNYTATFAVEFVERYNAPVIGPRLIPFLMLVVGFFPTSFSLVIALETFVGEKERNTLESLLAMPLSDTELYVGKILAALTLPVLASSAGIAIYLAGLYFSIGYRPEPLLLAQVWLLTVVEALVMVSAAVVISSQTTSVRAANLLASFVIIPVALLVQVEAVVFFSGDRRVLWLVIAALAVVDVILVRMGVRIFNREEILSREIDQLNLRRAARSFRTFLMNGPVASPWQNERFSLTRVYGRDIPELMRRASLGFLVVLLVAVSAICVGALFADVYRLPPHSIDLEDITIDAFRRAPALGFMPAIDTRSIFVHNAQSLLISAALSLCSFGAVGVILLAAPLAIVGWLVGQASWLGYDPALFALAFFLPHGAVELPAAFISTAFAVRIGASLMSPPFRLDVGGGLLMAVADFVKVWLFVVLPLLLLAAFVESNVTPYVVVALFGG